MEGGSVSEIPLQSYFMKFHLNTMVLDSLGATLWMGDVQNHSLPFLPFGNSAFPNAKSSRGALMVSVVYG